ncbi:XRE family transcriptional regulator [Limosilactobacillus reuteri]|uniref:XRE family transcriptional regulator n=1 Tax=Limosilactobacillus reuteri TaxID=1598 RepID=A0A317GKI7_LIMRT|nr:helix-turn-helix transcriptional regulator [Limosilactobacillus reuteri]MCH5384506.1 helix-turn-helix domain-containing protein [Limosilactobacillus reuteri]PWT48877.1 XRE family transcriptional regulator [Limosilactobacillus reuteri]PWT53445.1 XRE family transcriptional regulator [Limosilactobacillus reuteri]PWT64000.1 XRE family transcriptional regulator [Limosilactobacillus reuteri]
MEFRNYIKKRRNNLGFTQAEIAEKLHVTRQTISNWEQGKSYPDLDTLVKISDIYKISIDTLLKGDKNLKKYLDQGKAYNAFSIFRGLFFIMYGLFFLLTNYLVNYNSPTVNFCTFSFLIIFGVAILYGEHVKPLFLGMSKQTYRQKEYKNSQKFSLIGKIFFRILIIIIAIMVIIRNDANNYLVTLVFIMVGLMNIFQKYMFK